jgi:hypothetical protein
MPDYTSEEIRKWKSLIYGPNIGSGNKVDEWASGGNTATSTPRTRRSKFNSSVSGHFKPSGGTPKQSSSVQDEWLGESPCGTKRSYRTKGTKESIGRPSLY